MARELLERSTVLATLDDALRAAGRGEGRVVLLTGEAGIGKTSVLRTFRRRLPRTTQELSGGCDDLLTPRALGPLRDAVAARPHLAELLAIGHRDELFEALRTELTGPPTTAMLIEDLHWADDATLDLLGYLARRADRMQLLLVLTFRPDLLDDHPLRRVLGTLTGDHVIRLPLDPLSTDAVAQLAGGTRWDPATVRELTGGNPFYVTETLAVEPGDEVPETVAQAVIARTRTLSDPGRSAVQTISVVPGTVEIDLAEAVLGSQLPALDEAEQLGIVQINSAGIRFRHELARRAVQAGVPRLRRRALHRAMVGALLGRDRPDVPRIVHHAIQADDADTVIRHAPAAGRESAAAGSHRQALRHFEAALRYAERLTPQEHARLLDDYAWELYNAHRFREAVRLSDRAVGLFAQLDDPVAYGEALVRQSRHRYMNGDTEDAIASANAGVAVLYTADRPDSTAFAMTNLGSLLALGGDPDRASTVLDEAAHLARAGGRPELVGLCLNYQSIARPGLSDAERVDLMAASRRLAAEQGAHEYVARAYTNTAELLYRYQRFDDLQRCVDDGLSFTAEHGFRSHAYNLEVHRCLLLMRRGHWPAAEQGLLDLVEQLADPGMLEVYSVPPLARLRVRRDSGDPDTGEELHRVWRRAVHQKSLLGLAFAGTALVEWAWLQGRPDIVAQVVEQWLPHAARPTAGPVTGELWCYAIRAGVTVPARDDLPEPWAAALRGEWAAAARRWRAVGDPYEQALCLWRTGSVDDALTALALLDELGAQAPARLLREDLRRRGLRAVPRGPRARTRANPAGLTDRQLDVLMLAAHGHTNQHIAEELVLSVRTVEHHMSTVLAKFGVGTRQEAAEIAASWTDPDESGESSG